MPSLLLPPPRSPGGVRKSSWTRCRLIQGLETWLGRRRKRGSPSPRSPLQNSGSPQLPPLPALPPLRATERSAASSTACESRWSSRSSLLRDALPLLERLGAHQRSNATNLSGHIGRSPHLVEVGTHVGMNRCPPAPSAAPPLRIGLSVEVEGVTGSWNLHVSVAVGERPSLQAGVRRRAWRR